MPKVSIIGTGQLKYRSAGIEDAREPIDLMEEAAGAALADTGRSGAVLEALEQVVVVRTDSWRYDPDVGERLAKRLGARKARGRATKHGGDQPILHADLAARLIARGEIHAALVCGGESYASRRHYSNTGKTPPWTPSAAGVHEPALETPRRTLGNTGVLRSSVARQLGEAERHGLVAPIRIYPLYENALKAALGLTFAQNQQWSGQLYARFSEVAAGHPAAWDPRRRSVEEITTITERNRMICFPYPLLMNANQGVDQAAAVVLMSAQRAREIGIATGPYVWAGAGCHDTEDVTKRIAFDRSPAMAATLKHVLETAQLTAAEIDHLEIYSCFPVVPKLAARILGVDDQRSLTVTGGLSSFGGPGNAFALHSLATMTRLLREAPARTTGLVFAQGHYVTGHHALILGSSPPPMDWLAGADDTKRQAELDCVPSPTIARAPVGAGVIETFTAEFDRAGSPAKGWIVGRAVAENERFVAATAHYGTLLRLVSQTAEPVGETISVGPAPDGTNQFGFV